MNPHIRPTREDDLPDLARLMSLLAGHDISREQALDRLHMVRASAIDELYVIEADGRVRGLLGFRVRENVEEPSRYGEISAMVTDPDARRMGLGRALMDFAEDRARELGCKGTWLVSGLGREQEAHEFYKALGYQVTGHRFVKRHS